MIDYPHAVQQLLARTGPLPPETCALADACGRRLAGPIRSPVALPRFDHAAMDGYAFASGQSLAAGSEHAVLGSQAAGDALSGDSLRGGALEIMTGARLPPGFDSVVAVERCETMQRHAHGVPARIRLLETSAPGGNVRLAGSDVAEDEAVLAAGTRLASPHIMLLAALGVARVDVLRRPRVAVLCTGKELQAELDRPLAPDRIYNSNGPYLAAALAAAGAQVVCRETVDDTPAHFAAALARAVAAGVDLVISTGAVSMGRHDFVPETLRDQGAHVLFRRVAIRPGRPLLAATLAQGPLLLGLPGTPMAVAVGMRFFVVPVLRAMAGLGAEPVLRAWLDAPPPPRPGIRQFLRAGLQQREDGRLHASLLPRQQPFRILPFAQGDAWVVLPESDGGQEPAGAVDVVGVEYGAPLRIGRPT